MHLLDHEKAMAFMNQMHPQYHNAYVDGFGLHIIRLDDEVVRMLSAMPDDDAYWKTVILERVG